MADNQTGSYKNASRPWLTRMPGGDVPWKSTTHSEFTPPKKEATRTEGRKKELLAKFLWKELAEETAQESVEPTVEEYVTKYEEEFSKPDFKPTMPPEEFPPVSEVHIKYPVYRNETKFRKYAYFNRPW